MAVLTTELRNCFPSEGPITEYVEWAAGITHAPPVMHIAAITPLLGFELCRRGLSLQRYGPPCVWFGAVAPPAAGKTTVLSMARKFSADWYRSHFDHEAMLPKPWLDLEGSMQGVLQTMSSMTDTLSGITAGILHHTEFSRVLRAEDALEPLNKIYDHEPYSRNYRYLQKQAELTGGGAPTATIEKPWFSAFVTTTPTAFARTVRAETIDGGFFTRVMWLRERLNPKELMFEPGIDNDGRSRVLNAWSNWYGRMESLRLGGLSRTIAFDDTGRNWLRDVVFEGLRDLTARENYESGIALRVLPHTARLAAIYAASRGSVWRDQVYVQVEDIWRAANLAIRSMYDGISLAGAVAVATMNLSERQRLVLGAISRAGEAGLSRRQLYAVAGGHMDKGQLDLIMSSLEDAGLIVEEVGSAGASGGRPSRRAYSQEAWNDRNKVVAP